MTGIEYQNLAMRTNTEKPFSDQVMNAVLGLTGEAGECADMVKKAFFQGHELSGQELIKELGDVLWYIAQACDALGTNLDTVMEINIDKLKKRYPDGFKVEDSVNRTE